VNEKEKCVLLSVKFRNTIPFLDTLCRNSIKYVCFMLLSKRLTINSEINTGCILLFLRYKNDCWTEIIRMGRPNVQRGQGNFVQNYFVFISLKFVPNLDAYILGGGGGTKVGGF